MQAIFTKSDRKVVSSADVMHTSAQMTLKIHHHHWRRPCIGCLIELVGNMAVYNAAPHFEDHRRYGEQVHGRLQKWPLSHLLCTPHQKMTPEIQF